MSAELLEPSLEFVFELRVAVDDAVRIGRTDSEDLNFTPITGGTVEGPALSGRVLAGGGDWWVSRGRTTQLDAHYLIEASDGAAIDVVNRGYWRADDDVMQRLMAGEEVDEADLTTAPRSCSRPGPPPTCGSPSRSSSAWRVLSPASSASGCSACADRARRLRVVSVTDQVDP